MNARWRKAVLIAISTLCTGLLSLTPTTSIEGQGHLRAWVVENHQLVLAISFLVYFAVQLVIGINLFGYRDKATRQVLNYLHERVFSNGDGRPIKEYRLAVWVPRWRGGMRCLVRTSGDHCERVFGTTPWWRWFPKSARDVALPLLRRFKRASSWIDRNIASRPPYDGIVDCSWRTRTELYVPPLYKKTKSTERIKAHCAECYIDLETWKGLSWPYAAILAIPLLESELGDPIGVLLVEHNAHPSDLGEKRRLLNSDPALLANVLKGLEG